MVEPGVGSRSSRREGFEVTILGSGELSIADGVLALALITFVDTRERMRRLVGALLVSGAFQSFWAITHNGHGLGAFVGDEGADREEIWPKESLERYESLPRLG